MTLDADAIREIERLTREADGKIVAVDGNLYTTIPLHEPPHDPEPKAYAFRTLEGLVTYLEKNPDDLEPEDTLVHVVDPQRVDVWGKLQGRFHQRFHYAGALADFPALILGDLLNQQTFVIQLQTLFVDTGDRAAVLKFAGNVTAENVLTLVDDGVTQKATTRSGVSVVEMAGVPNPVMLAPYRTFREIEQPISEFVFRVARPEEGYSKIPRLGLFEADGGLWRLAAIQRIYSYLQDRLTGYILAV